MIACPGWRGARGLGMCSAFVSHALLSFGGDYGRNLQRMVVRYNSAAKCRRLKGFRDRLMDASDSNRSEANDSELLDGTRGFYRCGPR
ncbi:hypothetical protein NDN08_004267 [Rhodosorus marinus]|uniref:Secreted protein n=1 Tax=Rhodosorus marinus TaxID=101924 RepID=A0AAV8UKW9_9RHOD|nr:hypothetical protein NDN08_004267 [Rhodosorus marinus]